MYRIAKILYFLFYLCHIQSAIAADNDNTWGLEDCDVSNGPITFLGHTIESLHQDLQSHEVKVRQYLDQEKKNFMFGKLSFYFDEGEGRINFVDLPLHCLAQNKIPLLFDSFLERQGMVERLSDASCPVKVDYEKKDFDVDGINEPDVCGVSFPSSKAGNLAKRQRADLAQTVKSQQDAQSDKKIELKKTYKRIEEVALRGSKEDLGGMTKVFSCNLVALQQASKMYVLARQELGYRFWHSEPRVLFFLKKYINNAFYYGGLFLQRPLKAIILHLHSTYDSCPMCRLQLVGASYSWLYKVVVDSFTRNQSVPIFHIIFSWVKEYNKNKEFKKNKDKSVIDLQSMATYQETQQAISADTKPFISFLRLTDNQQ